MRRAWIVLLFALLAILVPITAHAVPDQKNDAPGQSVATGNYIAQSFTPAEDGYLEGFDLKLQLTGSGYMTINVHIYEVNENGLPGNRIAYGASQGLRTENKVTNFARFGGFNASVYLTGGKQYVLVIQGEGDYQYAYNAADTYSGGTRFTYDGSNWSVAQGDLQFQTWQSRYIIYSAVPDPNNSAHWGRTNDSWNQRSELLKLYSNDGVTFTAADSPLLDESGTEGWVLKRVGYRFGGGWSTKPNQDVAEYASGSVYPMTHSMKLYPIWRANSGKPNRYTMPVGGSVDWGAVLSSFSNPDYFRQDGYKYTALKTGSSTISLYYQDGVDYTRIWHDIYVDIVPDLPTSHTMVNGETVTFTSQTPGGSWNWSGPYFSRSGTTFTAINAGTTNITYTTNPYTGNAVTQTIAVTIVTNLPDTYTMTTTQTVDFAPQPAGGEWGYDSEFFTLSGSVFTPKKTGATTITYTVNGVTQSIAVTIKQGITGLPASVTLINGGSVSYSPQPAGGNWAYDNTFFDFVEATGTFTAKTAGTTTISYTTADDVTHNISATVVTNLPDSLTMIDGGSHNFAPVPSNGSWVFGGLYLTRSGSTFTGKLPGQTMAEYTLNGVMQHIDITVVTNLPDTRILTEGDSIDFAPVPSTGTWGFDPAYFTRSGLVFTAIKAGTSTITYTVNSVTQSIAVTIRQAITNLPESKTCIVGDAITFYPQPAGGSWTYDGAYFDRNGSTFTAKQAGTATIGYTTLEGVIKNMAVTIVTNLPESHTLINGESIDFAPVPSSGTWGFDFAYFTRSGSRFTAIKVGMSTITYTLNGVTQSVLVSSVTDLPDSLTLIDGNFITLSPVPSGGSWGYDGAYLSQSGQEFAALRAGTTAVTYTLNGVTQNIAVTIVTDLPNNYALTRGETVDFAPVPADGAWGYDAAYFSRSGSTFTSIRAGTSPITYTVNGVAQTISVWVKQPITGLPASSTMVEGETVTFTPQPSGGSWGFDAEYFDYSEGSIIFTAKKAGTTDIVYTTAEGVSQTIPITVVTNLPDEYTLIEGETVGFEPVPSSGAWGFDAAYVTRVGSDFSAVQTGTSAITYTVNGVTQSILVTVAADLPDSITLVEGETINLAPYPSTGTWGFDAAYVTRDGSDFTAVQTGTSAITYTVNGVMQSILVTVAADLPDSITIIEGETIDLAPYPSTGTWGFDAAYVTRDGSAFTAVQTGTSTITYTVNGVMQSILVTVAADLPDSITIIEGETFSFAPYPSTGIWEYDATYFSRNGSTFRALRLGSSSITYTINGVAQNIAVTLRKSSFKKGAQATAKVLGANAIIRSDATSNASIRGTVPKEAIIEIWSYKNGFVQLSYHGQTAWINADYLMWIYPYRQAMQGVSQKKQFLYLQKSEGSEKLVRIDKGQEITILGRSEAWWIVAYNGMTGYVYARNATISE